MKPTGKVSDEEVSAAIRYLDPDFHESSQTDKHHGANSRSRRWIAASLLILAAGVIVYVVLRYLPAIVHLLHRP